MSPGRLALVAALALNVALAGAWLWAQGEREVVRVVVSGGSVQAFVGDQPLAAAPAAEAGRVALYLGSRGAAQRAGEPAPVAWLDRESAWSSVTVRRLADGAVLLHRTYGPADEFPAADDPAAPRTLLGDPAWQDYVVEAELRRGREDAGVEVAADGAGGTLVLFRPRERDLSIWERGPAGLRGPVAAAAYRAYGKGLGQSAQDLLRLLLRAYPFALALAGLGGLGAVVRGRPTPSTPSPAGEGGTDPHPRPLSHVVGEGCRRRGEGRLCTPLALGVAAAGFAVAAYVAYFVLQRMPHVQDSVAYLFQAKVFALGRLWAPVPALPRFFEHEFVVMYQGKWFAKYPPGQPALLAIGVLAGAPWLVSPVAAGLSLYLVYLIGRRAYGPGTGLLAAALGLTSPFLIFMSGSFMAHSTGLLFVLLFVWLYLRAADLPGSRLSDAALAGAALGAAFLIRPWTAGVIAAPFAALGLVEVARQPRRVLGRYAAMAGAFLPFVVAWLGYNWALTGDPLRNTMELWWAFDRVGFGPDKGMWGHTLSDGLWNASRNFGELLTHLFGWPPFLTLGFATLLFVAGRARRRDWLFLAGFACLVAGYVAWWADGIMYGPRFYYEGLGFLLLLTARGVVEAAGLAGRAAARWGWSGRRVGPALAGGLLGLLVLYNAGFYLPSQWGLYHGYNYVNRGPVDAVEAAGLHHALVFADTGEWYEWWYYGMVFSSDSPLLDGDVVYARDLGEAADRELLALYPSRPAYRLKGTTLTPLAP